MKYTDFVAQLIEAANSTKQLKHLSHLEDLMYEEGSAAVPDIVSSIEAFLSILKDRKFTGKTKLTTKWDGSPSIIIHSKDNDFWVASKSAFNVNPKLNRTEEDIQKNHGHAPGLVEKLTYALKYCKSLGINGTVQGDFLYTKTDLQIQMIDGQKHVTFKPNTITYAVLADSALGKRILASQMGIIIHTEYDDEFNTKNVGTYSVAKLKKSKNVFFDDAHIKDATADISLSAEESESVMSALAKIQETSKKLSKTFLDDLANHSDLAPLMAKYNNANVRAGSYATPEAAKGFAKYISGEFEKEKTKVKSEAKKQEKETKRTSLVSYIEKNQANLALAYEMYSAIVSAKLTIMTKLNKLPSMKSFMVTDNGLQATPPEGFVAVHDGRVFKLVDRLEFSAKNFAARPRGGSEVKESVELDEARTTDKETVVFCFGRTNPPTVGHKLMFDTVVGTARKLGCDYQIWISKSQDNKKNPLTVEQKLFWLRKMFPGYVFHGATAELPTLMKIATVLNTKYKKLVMVAGSDRIEEYKKLLNAYNGKDYNYDSIEFVSAGQRDADSEGVAGVSATKMRNAALENDVVTFSKGVTKTLTKDDIQTLMSQIVKGMGVKKKKINEIVDPVSGMEIAKNIYKVLVGGAPMEELEDPNEVVREALRLSKTKEFNDEMNKLIEAGRKAGLTIDVGEDDDEYKPKQVSYADFMKMLGSEKPGSSKEYLARAKKEYIREEKKDDEEYDEEDDMGDNVEEYGELSDKDIESIVGELDDEDIIDHVYDEDEFAEVDAKTGEPTEEDDEDEDDEEDMKEELINEVLSRQERIRRAVRFKRTETKRERLKTVALHRYSSQKVISKRARRAAILAVKAKMFKGRDVTKLSQAEKERAERRVQALARTGSLARIAVKMVPRIRKIEQQRLSHDKYTR